MASALPPVPEKMQVFTQRKNPITGCTEWDLQHEEYDYHQEIARSAFADMLHDTERNQKYYLALKKAVDRMHADGKMANVLDIGTGTGLLSIMAARCGADSVVACEAFKPMADCCQKILEKNGMAEKIRLIPKRSTELTVGHDGDLKERVNILVTEVFDTELIGEGALPTFAHAHKHLLEPDCIVVPDSAVVYAQVVECPTLQKWNKLTDLADDNLQILLRAPQKMKDCAGSAAVHDVQLSQLPRTSFRALSDQLPVFHYDWSGKTPLDMKRTVKQQFSATATGVAQAVFMWWKLNMDPQGRIVLSCAPWWAHPDANLQSKRPQDTIPWRDHWMQAVYYLPQQIQVKKKTEITLISCQDEYSLWFYLEDKKTKPGNYKRPICECGVHMAYSRTHVSYLNDGRRTKLLLSQLKDDLRQTRQAIVLDLNGASFMGLAASKMGAKKVYVLESLKLNIDILKDYCAENEIENVEYVAEVDKPLLEKVSHIVCDLNLCNAILPWENLRVAYYLHKFRDCLGSVEFVIPLGCEFWAMPVEFKDLHKIRIPLNICENIDMTIFDNLVENSRAISDAEIDSQPLWEYPTWCRGVPRKLIDVDFIQLKPSYGVDGIFEVPLTRRRETQQDGFINGFAIWAQWRVGARTISSGPLTTPQMGQLVDWNPHTRQAVQILKKSHKIKPEQKWSYQLACDLMKGRFDLSLQLETDESEE